MRLFPRHVKGQPEDTAVRIALREIAREALALENLIADDRLWGSEPRDSYRRAVERARVVGEMQWPPARDSEGRRRG